MWIKINNIINKISSYTYLKMAQWPSAFKCSPNPKNVASNPNPGIEFSSVGIPMYDPIKIINK